MADDLEARLRTHFDDTRKIPGEKSFTRPLLTEAADALAAARGMAEQERAAIVAWLRDPTISWNAAAKAIAAAIERKDHLAAFTAAMGGKT